MSVDHHSEQSSDIIVGDVTTVTTYSGDYRDQSATTNESRDEVDVTEMLSLTTQLVNLSITSANLTGRMLEPPSAHDRGVQGDVADPEKGFWAVFMMISISRMVSHHNLGAPRHIPTYEYRLP
ncbi:uncharacterized protein FRV6_16084 [Fusarium oxysporum]|uniref:Uncharacterized protein n=1 Tax=Fusarium oxysporum TaxID=5507 RepID=A0A2H3U9G0_FUSOX|nr:hypothetical protein QWA68_011657 [Fusarium oxysporum]SCO91956.1 uncharacterized protein FRV6_16084 [Fusarium oxysporum]